MVKKLKKLPKRDKYLISAIANLLWYCVAALVLAALEKDNAELREAIETLLNRATV